MKKLPVGYSTLENIINDNCTYVDKSMFVKQLSDDGKYYFLSRPRRFGKSLFLDTLKQAFLGNRTLFKGLYLENNWDWEVVYPVIHISLGSGELGSKDELSQKINEILQYNADVHEVELSDLSISGKFLDLIRRLNAKCNQKVVILVDEYDKPMLDNIIDRDICIDMRSGLRDLYSVIKDADAYIKFVFITGVSKFSKISLFSGLNNIEDITLTGKYADICGYTQHDLKTVFAEYLSDGAVDLIKLKQWYNGYNFTGADNQKVYNPFDILLFFKNDYLYKNYWFETGSPKFLIDLVEKDQYYIPNLEQIRIDEADLAKFDAGSISLPTLLLQTGYLTITGMTTIGSQLAYILSYPNLEVKASLNGSFITIGTTIDNKSINTVKLDDILRRNNLDGMATVFVSHFAAIPHDWYRNNNIANYEGFYSSVVYSYFCALGYEVIAEDTTNHGQIELTIKTYDKIVILEFKLSKYGDAKEALAQIRTKKYAEKYQQENKAIYLVGISFNPDDKNIYDYAWERN